MDKRTYKIIIGSKSFFDDQIKEFKEEAEYFLDLVRIFDEIKQRGYQSDQFKASSMILKNNNYHGIVESAHDRLGSLIEELTTDDATIYIHNPPRVLETYLEDLCNREIVHLTRIIEEYTITRQPEHFSENMSSIAQSIIGQNNAVYEISKSMWYLTTVNRKKPYVIMLYGKSSLGKTELVREISKKFFEGKFMEKHLSMFKNEAYSYYFFGDRPNRRSLGFDLLERESNLIFLDELDKCPEYFYSAFYTLFDNTIFSDATYDVDISGLLIILTSNFSSLNEIKESLGLPIFYRIDKFIEFNDFSEETIYELTMKEIESIAKECEGLIDRFEVYSRVSKIIQATGENARTIKSKILSVIEELLFQEVTDIRLSVQENIKPLLK
ncbi:AAA family ATPase [Paenibacillus phoenicis]|uniref:AAA family ATPase n=1 Tax=Paenibacillus phoenicis TaxID=554117 RepID=A0ABU5PIE1_9BACL|nr:MULTISPECIES: AAA family ATPase [Paenibacillus]MCT2196832.1 AAA family ATPase [Paenibacillus sp. p3-SID1389]MEA3569724.1 AAA family ATPase [Paenibacillus phoenicis]